LVVIRNVPSASRLTTAIASGSMINSRPAAGLYRGRGRGGLIRVADGQQGRHVTSVKR
jgi:hypothetical protein